MVFLKPDLLVGSSLAEVPFPSFDAFVGSPQPKPVEETAAVSSSPLASTVLGGVTLDLPFNFPTMSLTPTMSMASGSKVSIPSSPFSISPSRGEEDLLLD